MTLHGKTGKKVMTQARYFNTLDKENSFNTLAACHNARLIKISFCIISHGKTNERVHSNKEVCQNYRNKAASKMTRQASEMAHF